MPILTGAGGVTLETRAADDDVLVLPPLPADPVFIDAVDEALAGGADALPGAQPERPVGADPHDFASLYIRHRASFGLHARRFLNDPRDVEEVLQEAFLRLFLAMPELDCELQALSYCRRTVTNLCIDRYRADQRRPRLVDLEEMTLDPRDQASYDDPVLRAEDAAIVRQALALLSPIHRAALVKREIEEKPLAQIAAELDVPEESVKHLLHRARRALRRLLVGTSVQPGVDLSNTQLLRVANERLARATLRGANVLIVLFVAVVSVVGGLRITTQDRSEGSGEAMTPAVTPAVVGGSTDPAHPLTPRSDAPKAPAHHSAAPPADEPLPPTVAPQPAAAPVPAPRPAHHAASTPTRHHPVPRPTTGVTAPTPSGLQPGTFSIHAPVLGATGAAVVRTTTVELKPTGEWSNTSDFIAPTAAGDFNIQQVVEQSTEGVVSANLSPTVPVAPQDSQPSTALPSTMVYSSAVTTAPSEDGNVLVNVALQVVPQAPPAVTPVGSPPLNIQVQALYTPDVTRVLAETVTVVEGSAPCCDSSASSTPRNTPTDGATTVAPSPDPAAVGSEPVSDLSPTRPDDQAAPTSS